MLFPILHGSCRVVNGGQCTFVFQHVQPGDNTALYLHVCVDEDVCVSSWGILVVLLLQLLPVGPIAGVRVFVLSLGFPVTWNAHQTRPYVVGVPDAASIGQRLAWGHWKHQNVRLGRSVALTTTIAVC